jgi:hypothetical protein
MSPGTRIAELNPCSAQQSLFAMVQACLHKQFAQSQRHLLLCPPHSRPSLDTCMTISEKERCSTSILTTQKLIERSIHY